MSERALVRLEFQPMGEEIPDPISFYIDMTQTNLRQTGIDIVLKVGSDQLARRFSQNTNLANLVI